MLGHSKWYNIQKTGGVANTKRSQISTKIAREMITAVKTGGSDDSNNNSRPATVIAKAKTTNVPSDSIKRTIDKVLGSGSADGYENVVCEGYGPSGVVVVVDTLVDNRNRTAPGMRHLLDKCGRGLGATGCLSRSLDRKGVITIEKKDLDEDTVTTDALDAGADDMQVEEEISEAYTDPDAFGSALTALEEKGYTFVQTTVETVPQNCVGPENEDNIKSMKKLTDLLEGSDDVQNA